MIKNIPVFFLFFLILFYAGCTNKNSENINLVKYLNQPAPGSTPVVVAKNFLPPNNRDVVTKSDIHLSTSEISFYTDPYKIKCLDKYLGDPNVILKRDFIVYLAR